MPEMATRYPCPVCLGVMMDTVRIGDGAALEIDHCARCGGVWFDAGEIERLRTFASAALWSRIARREADAVTPCHGCHAPLDRGAEKCAACGRKNVLDCPVCDRRMERRAVGGIHVDSCRRCKGVWLDHRELDTVWQAAAIATLPAAGDGLRTGGQRAAETAGDVALNVMWYAPDVAAHTVIGAAHAASHLPAVVAAAPEAAVHLAGAAGDAAGGIFEAIAAIFEAIFSGLDF